MVDFEKDLKIARDLFEKRLQTVKRIKQHIRHLSESTDEYSAGKVALKIAKAEVRLARHILENKIQRVRKNPPAGSPSKANNTQLRCSEERDHFSEALARVDPKCRLQLDL